MKYLFIADITVYNFVCSLTPIVPDPLTHLFQDLFIKYIIVYFLYGLSTTAD